jgi:hypothetical protein
VSNVKLLIKQAVTYSGTEYAFLTGMNTLHKLASAAALGAVLLSLSAPAAAAPVYCAAQSTTRNYMGVDDSQVSACLGAGVGNIGQGGGNDEFLSSAAGAGWSNVSDDFTLDFGQTNGSGTWSFDSSAWDSYANLAIGFKFGTGNQPDEWFVYSLQDLVSSGDWEFFNVHRRGGGLSHLVLYASGERTVPEPGTLGLLGLGLAGMAAGLRRRRKTA